MAAIVCDIVCHRIHIIINKVQVQVQVQVHRWAHPPVIHAASLFYHRKRVAWVYISMHTCGSVSIIMELCFSGRQSSAIILFLLFSFKFFATLCFVTLRQSA